MLEAGASEGAASVDYFYFDPAPHEALTLHVTQRRAGSASSHVDVYVRFGEWPTEYEHDAAMRCARGGQRAVRGWRCARWPARCARLALREAGAAPTS